MVLLRASSNDQDEQYQCKESVSHPDIVPRSVPRAGAIPEQAPLTPWDSRRAGGERKRRRAVPAPRSRVPALSFNERAASRHRSAATTCGCIRRARHRAALRGFSAIAGI